MSPKYTFVSLIKSNLYYIMLFKYNYINTYINIYSIGYNIYNVYNYI